MIPQDLQARCRACLSPRYLTRIAERLRVSHRHVEAWDEGLVPFSEQHIDAIERFLAARTEANQLVTQWMEALNKRAVDAGLNRSDILAALARRPEIGAACVALAEDRRTSLSCSR